MSDKSLVVSPQSWHARRYHASEGNKGVTNLCHYFWVVVKSLLSSVFSASFVKSTGRIVTKIAGWVISTIFVVGASAISLIVLLVLLSMLGSWVLALVASLAGSEMTPQNTIPLFAFMQGDHPTHPFNHSDVMFFVYTSIALDCLIVLALSVWGVSEYNKKHQAGFIRLSWERFKVWKDGTVVCPLIEFDEPK